MNLLREKLRARGHHLAQGGGSSSSSASKTETTNNDNRMAVQDGIGLSSSNGNSVSYNSTDAVRAVAGQSTDAIKAISLLGADVIKSTGGAVVELNRDSVQANATAWDMTTKRGLELIENIAEKGFGISEKAIASYEPTDNKNAETLKWAAIAGAAVVALQFIKK